MQEAVQPGRGAMAAVIGLDSSAVERLCARARDVVPGEVIEPANVNAPGQVVDGGHR